MGVGTILGGGVLGRNEGRSQFLSTPPAWSFQPWPPCPLGLASVLGIPVELSEKEIFDLDFVGISHSHSNKVDE